MEQEQEQAKAERDAAIARAEKAEREANEADQLYHEEVSKRIAAEDVAGRANAERVDYQIRAKKAEDERDRLAGLVREAGDMLDGLREEFAALAEGRRSKYKSHNNICAYDNADVLSSRLKAEGGANG